MTTKTKPQLSKEDYLKMIDIEDTGYDPMIPFAILMICWIIFILFTVFGAII